MLDVLAVALLSKILASLFLAMATDPWLVGAHESRVRHRSQLHAALVAYTSGRYSGLFDDRAKDALFGAHDLVIESFLLAHQGRHVGRWASGIAGGRKGGSKGKGKLDPRSACSQGTMGLLKCLEYFRQQNADSILAPRGLVPPFLLCVCCVRVCWHVLLAISVMAFDLGADAR